MKQPSSRTLFGYPAGAWLIVAVEFWERFSFYGMLAILVLFLTAEPAKGGFGWGDGEALTVLGVYTGLMYALPALGGYLAERVWGNRRAVWIGASLLVLGHFLMAAPALVPVVMPDVGAALTTAGVPLGKLALPVGLQSPELAGSIGQGRLETAYRLTTVAFYGALTLLVLGNALMKSTLVVLVGDLFPKGDARRDGAYAYYYLGISLGGFLSGLAVGWVADRFGWHWGFTLAGIGMTTALSLYGMLGPSLLGDAGREPVRPTAAESVDRRDAGPRFGILTVLALLLFIFEIGWFQLYGTWSLFLERSIDRTLGGFTIPVPWFLALNALLVIVLTPPVARWLVAAERAGRHYDIITKYLFAMVMAALGNGLFALAAARGFASPVIPMVATALVAVGELAAWIPTYGIVYRTAPKGLVAAAMGMWYLMTLGAGGYFAGKVGVLVETLGMAPTFAAVTGLLLLGVVVGIVIRPWLRQMAARCEVTL